MRELLLGVIGCGNMARNVHVPNVNEIPGCKTVAYADLDESRARQLYDRYGGFYCTADPERIFRDDRIDGVLIQTGERAHPRLIAAAVRAGKHLFCEKPLAVTLEEARSATLAVLEAERNGIKFQFGTCNRLAPNTVRAKRLLPHPIYSYCQCTDTISAQFCHNIDLAMNLFHASPVESVYAVGGHYYDLDPHLPADSFTCIVRFRDGSSHTSIQHGKARNLALSKYHFQLFGTDRCVYLANRFKHCEFFVGTERKAAWIFDGPDFVRGDIEYMGHKAELEQWVDCIRHGGRPDLTIEDALRILAVEKAVLHSILTGTVVDFPRFWAEQVGSDVRASRWEAA